MSDDTLKIQRLCGDAATIIPSDKVQHLMDVDALIIANKQHAQDIIEQAEAKAHKIELEAHERGMALVYELQSDLLEECEELVHGAFDNLELAVNKVIERILHKFLIVKPDNLGAIIKQELHTIKSRDLIVTVRGNSYTLDVVRYQLDNLSGECIYDLDDAMPDDSCELETNWFLFRVDIDSALDYVRRTCQ